jgi:hypothetical protein
MTTKIRSKIIQHRHLSLSIYLDISFFCFDTGSLHVVHDYLKFTILLTYSPYSGDNKCEPLIWSHPPPSVSNGEIKSDPYIITSLESGDDKNATWNSSKAFGCLENYLKY